MLYELTKNLENMFFNESYEKANVDILKKDNGYIILAEYAGCKKEDISITYEDDYLTLEAKKQKENGKYLLNEINSYKKRVIYLPQINEKEIKASLNDGILTINVSFKEKDVKTINIE